MPFNPRLFLVMIHAAFVVAISMQSALDTPHHLAPPAYQAVATGVRIDVAQDLIDVAAEDSSTAQHESETGVDHAMIGPVGVAGLPPLRGRINLDLKTADLPGDRLVATIERPPRAALAA